MVSIEYYFSRIEALSHMSTVEAVTFRTLLWAVFMSTVLLFSPSQELSTVQFLYHCPTSGMGVRTSEIKMRKLVG